MLEFAGQNVALPSPVIAPAAKACHGWRTNTYESEPTTEIAIEVDGDLRRRLALVRVRAPPVAGLRSGCDHRARQRDVLAGKLEHDRSAHRARGPARRLRDAARHA